LAERLTFSVDSPPSHPDLLTVEDAFKQILDYFELAVHSGNVEYDFVWRLISASVKSPFTVVAEAVSVHPDIDVEPLARAQKRAFANNVVELRKGKIPDDWSAGKIRNTANKVLARYGERVGVTLIKFDLPHAEIPDILVTPDDARIAAGAMGEPFVLETPKAKEQIGSVEGFLVGVGTYWKRPAVRIRERKSGSEIWCEVPEEFRSEFTDKTNFDDVWNNRHVLIRGRIAYGSAGEISRISANEITPIDSIPISTEKIRDKDFTGGLTAEEYLKKLREGNIG